MNFEDEHYVRVYTRDTKTWKRLGFEGQTVLMHVLRRLDKAGVLDDIEDPVPDVALVTGVPEEFVSVGLERCLQAGVFELRGTYLLMPRYIEGQTARRSNALRAKESRQRRRALAMASQIVTDASRNERVVTGCDAVERERSGCDAVTYCDSRVTNRDGPSRNAANRHEAVRPRHSTQINADQIIDPKAAEADPNLTAGSDPTPSGVQRQRQREGSHDAGSGYPIAGPQSDSQSSSEPIRTGCPSGTENDSETPTRPRNLKQALQVPIRERAQVLVDEEHLEIWLEPHRWPEVLELGERFASALGWTRPRMTRASDARRLVHLLAAFDAAELDRAVEAAPGDDWLTTGRKGLGSLSVEVVSRLLAPKRVAKARSTRYPHRQPDYEGERTFSAADLFAGGDGYVIAGGGR